jgi:hypothetical protein
MFVEGLGFAGELLLVTERFCARVSLLRPFCPHGADRR